MSKKAFGGGEELQGFLRCGKEGLEPSQQATPLVSTTHILPDASLLRA